MAQSHGLSEIQPLHWANSLAITRSSSRNGVWMNNGRHGRACLDRLGNCKIGCTSLRPCIPRRRI